MIVLGLSGSLTHDPFFLLLGTLMKPLGLARHGGAEKMIEKIIPKRTRIPKRGKELDRGLGCVFFDLYKYNGRGCFLGNRSKGFTGLTEAFKRMVVCPGLERSNDHHDNQYVHSQT